MGIWVFLRVASLSVFVLRCGALLREAEDFDVTGAKIKAPAQGARPSTAVTFLPWKKVAHACNFNDLLR